MSSVIEVAVAVIYYEHQDQRHYLLAYRHQHQHQGNRYEFVGGKIEAGEEPETALIREVAEEIGLTLLASQLTKLGRILHDYGDKAVRLHIYQAPLSIEQYQKLSSQQQGLEGQALIWAALSSLVKGEYQLPAANLPILTWLQLPSGVVITHDFNHFANHSDPVEAWVDFHCQRLPNQSVVYLRAKPELLVVDDHTTHNIAAILQKHLPTQWHSMLWNSQLNSQPLDNYTTMQQGMVMATIAMAQLMQQRPDLQVILPASVIKSAIASLSRLTPISSKLDSAEPLSQIRREQQHEQSMALNLANLIADNLVPYYQRGQIIAHQLTQAELMTWPSGDDTLNNGTSNNGTLNNDTFNDDNLRDNALKNPVLNDNAAPTSSHQRTLVNTLQRYYQQLPILASCHDAICIQCANELAQSRINQHQGALMAIFISPVQPTKTHPGQACLDWHGLEPLAEKSNIPVIALGGLSVSDISKARQHGATCVAGIRQFMTS